MIQYSRSPRYVSQEFENRTYTNTYWHTNWASFEYIRSYLLVYQLIFAKDDLFMLPSRI